MNLKKFVPNRKILLATSLLSLSLLSINQLPTEAQNVPKKVASNYDITFEPPSESQPQATIGGASRGGQCYADSQNISQPFAPLLPASNQGLTTASHPTLLAYIPTSAAGSIFLNLQDENEEEVYQAILPINNQSGVISLDLPPEAPGLETGKNYKWSFALMCDNKLRPDSPVIEGYITRVQPRSELANQLEKATPTETVALYGQAGIWYETVAILAELRQSEPQNQELVTAWNNILNSVGLEKVAKAELID